MSVLMQVITVFETKSRNLSTFRAYLQKNAKLMDLYKQYEDREGLESMAEHEQELKGMREVLAMNESGKHIGRKRSSRSLRQGTHR